MLTVILKKAAIMEDKHEDHPPNYLELPRSFKRSMSFHIIFLGYPEKSKNIRSQIMKNLKEAQATNETTDFPEDKAIGFHLKSYLINKQYHDKRTIISRRIFTAAE